MVLASEYPTAGSEVWMIGFAGGQQWMGTKGRVMGYVSPTRGGHNTFLNTSCDAKQGCSGGPFLNAKGEVVGSLTAAGDGSIGPCLSVVLPSMKSRPMTLTIKPAVSSKMKFMQVVVQGGGSLFPWRNEVGQEFGKINGELGAIDQKLSRPPVYQAQPQPIVITAPSNIPAVPAGPDPTCMAAISQLTNTTSQQGQQIGQLAAGLTETSKQVQAVADNVKQHGTLLERITANKEADLATNPGESKAKADLDALKQSLAFNNHGILFVLGTIGVILLVTWGIIHLVANLRQVADKTAAANPNDPLAQANAKFLDGLDNFNKAIQAIPAGIAGAVSSALPVALGPVGAPVGVAGQVASLAGTVAAQGQQLASHAAAITATALATPTATSTPAVVNVSTTPAAASH
jgi:hypothetical protein